YGPRPSSTSFSALWKKYRPKSIRDPDSGSPSTSMCDSSKCRPRGRTIIVGIWYSAGFFNRYDFLCLEVTSISWRIELKSLTCMMYVLNNTEEQITSTAAHITLDT